MCLSNPGGAVRTTDLSSLLIVAAILALAGLVASYLPVRHAIRIDPVTALRHP